MENMWGPVVKDERHAERHAETSLNSLPFLSVSRYEFLLQQKDAGKDQGSNQGTRPNLQLGRHYEGGTPKPQRIV